MLRFRASFAALAIILFLATRLLSLTSLPIFNDEASYLHWGQITSSEQLPWWPPYTHAGKKQPGIVFLLGLVQKLPGDPLILGRLVSVGFGLISFLLTLWVYRKLRQKDPLVVPSLLYIFCPYLIFFDRIALAESAVVATSVATLLLTLALTKKPTTGKAIALAVVLVFGWWMKSTTFVLVPAVLASLILVAYEKPVARRLFFKSLLFVALTVTILFLFGLLGPQSQVVPDDILLSPSQIMQFPLKLWLTNALSAITWLIAYLSPLVFVFALLGVRIAVPKTEGKILVLFATLPLLAELLIAKLFTSRYLVLVTPPLLLLAAEKLRTLKKGKMITLTAMVLPAVIASLILIRSPLSFFSLVKYLPLARDDFGQYVRSWSSGWGVREAASFIARQAQEGDTVVFVRPDSGNPEDAMYVYLSREPWISVVYVNDLGEMLNQKESLNNPTFLFVSRGPQYAGLEGKLFELARFPKPLDDEFIGVYQIQPNGL